MRVTVTLNFHHQLKESAIPLEVGGVSEVLHNFCRFTISN